MRLVESRKPRPKIGAWTSTWRSGRELDHELKAGNVVPRLVAAFGRPSHLHKGRDGNRSIADGESATHKNGRLEGTRTQNASTSVTQILDAALKFLRRLTRGKS
jgi:hypothetical protein